MSTRISMVAAIVVTALVASACGGSNSGAPAGGGAAGTIAISGSSTVEPISSRVAEAFKADHPDAGVSVEGPGTGDGFAKFCNGETDISDASRPIKDAEIQRCKDAGVDYIELHIATDGLSVLTSNANDTVSCLSKVDLYALTGPESIGFTKWSDANDLATQVAAQVDPSTFGPPHTPYPDAPLVITGPGEESGTFDTYIEMALATIAEARGQDPTTRPDYTASANDNVIIEGIAGSDTSLGWVGYAYYLANENKVKALAIDAGNGCVDPTPETIASFEYPLSRPLFIYVNVHKAEANPIVADFVDFYLSDEGLAKVTEAGYVALDDYTATRDRWTKRETGAFYGRS